MIKEKISQVKNKKFCKYKCAIKGGRNPPENDSFKLNAIKEKLSLAMVRLSTEIHRRGPCKEAKQDQKVAKV